MKKLALIALILSMLTGCAKSPPSAHIWMSAAPSSSGFSVDQYIAVVMEYQGTRALVGVDTYGPTSKEAECMKASQAAVAQSGDMLPLGHMMVTTCLETKFGGPLPHGVALPVPIAGIPFEYLTIGVEYTKTGDFVGAQALHAAPDVKTCMHEARDLLDTNYRDGSVPAGNSLLLYCMPIPVIEKNPKNEGGIV